ncbi:unnamed protein product [Prorocentrum cordatum]|uniref:Uncharacterized protein n=1 Tax=Prorocentrum cordatum TaxID=2364126 RepID=A0ABN9X0V6_9DINO|nr:unnamed protein product [Polarella glacialis]
MCPPKSSGSMALPVPRWGVERAAEEDVGSGGVKRQLIAAGAKATTRKEKVDKMAVLLGVLALTQVAEVRDLIGASHCAAILDADHAIAMAMAQAGKGCHAAAEDLKGDPKGEADLLGPPFLRVFKELVRAARGLATVGEDRESVLGMFWEEVILQKPLMEVVEQARHCRCRLTRRKKDVSNKVRIALCSCSQWMELERAALSALRVSSAECK